MLRLRGQRQPHHPVHALGPQGGSQAAGAPPLDPPSIWYVFPPSARRQRSPALDPAGEALETSAAFFPACSKLADDRERC